MCSYSFALSLTHTGQGFFTQCQQHLEAIHEASLLAANAQSMPSGKMTIAAETSFAMLFVQSWIEGFLKKYPLMQVGLQTMDSLPDMVESGIDVGFNSGSVDIAGFIGQKIGSPAKICCASSDYLAKAGTPQKPDELVHHSCILFGASLQPQTWYFRQHEHGLPCSSARIQRVRLFVEYVMQKSQFIDCQPLSLAQH